jgi:signal transduction histidine kinase
MTRPPSAGPQPGDEVRAIREELDRTREELREALERLHLAQGQIVQAGRLSALGQLVAGVAHEMNNPLTSVIGHAQLVHQQLVRRPDLAAELTELLPDIENIVAEASRAGRIVRNLLLFARKQGAARNFQDIEFLCEQIVELRSYDLRMNGVEISTSFAPGLPAVFAEGSQIQQVLLNLVLNAEQAVRRSATKRVELIVTAEPDCGAVLLEVRDSGEGIDRGSLGRVFEPFFTTRAVGEGTGLGLSIARTIVRDHGGQIWAESRPQVRTSFFIRLRRRSSRWLARTTGSSCCEDEEIRRPGVRIRGLGLPRRTGSVAGRRGGRFGPGDPPGGRRRGAARSSGLGRGVGAVGRGDGADCREPRAGGSRPVRSRAPRPGAGDRGTGRRLV